MANAAGPMLTASVMPLDSSDKTHAEQTTVMLAIQLADGAAPSDTANLLADHEAKERMTHRLRLYAKAGEIQAKGAAIKAKTGSINHKVPPSG